MRLFYVVEKSWTLLAVVAVLTAADRSGFKGQPRKTVFQERGNAFGGAANRNAGQNDDFPSEMFFGMTMEGVGNVDLHLVRDKFMHMPNKWIQAGSNMADMSMKTSFYTDANGYGSFACVSKTDSNGRTSCQLAALLDMGDETCFIAPGFSVADCTTSEGGVLQYYEELTDGSIVLKGSATIEGSKTNTRVQRSTQEHVATRPKRSIFPSPGFFVVEVAFVGDQAFMQSFYDRHPGNATAAQEEAALFVTLVTNEINVYYATIKDVSEGEIDIYVYPVDLIIPEVDTDFDWIENHSDGTMLYADKSFNSAVYSALNYGDLVAKEQWDHVFIMTGLDIEMDDVLGIEGYAYLKTVCSTSGLKFSLNEYRDTSLARIGAHEIGHALGISHDGNDGNNECEDGLNIMTSYFHAIMTQKDRKEFYKFSKCSVEFLSNRFKTENMDCINQHGFTEMQFKEKFCSGLPGAQEGWLTMQCQKSTGWTGSTPCNMPENVQDCFTPYRIGCKTIQGPCKYMINIWQGTPCGQNKVCYGGNCVKSFDICDVTTSPSTTITTTKPTTTTMTAPCDCCSVKRGRKRKNCCRRGRKQHDKAECYCCGSLRNVFPPLAGNKGSFL